MITLGYLSLADVGPLDIIEAAGASGFRSVGLRLTSRRLSEPWRYGSISVGSSRQALGRALAASGTALSNVCTFHLWPETTLEHLKPVVDASAELGAKTLIACVYRDLDASLVEFWAIMPRLRIRQDFESRWKRFPTARAARCARRLLCCAR